MTRVLALLALLLRQPRGGLSRRVPSARSRPLGPGLPTLGAVRAGAGRSGPPLRRVWAPVRASGAPGQRGPAPARSLGGAERRWRGAVGLARRPGGGQRRAEGAAGAPQARPQVPLAVVQEHEAAL